MNNEITKILGTSVRIGECILMNTQADSSSPWALGVESSLPSHSPSSVLIIFQHPQHLSITLLRGSSLSCPRIQLSSDLSSSCIWYLPSYTWSGFKRCVQYLYKECVLLESFLYSFLHFEDVFWSLGFCLF